ncbi:MAG: flagellar biosynthesis protein FlhB [Stappiaceae bacterium]
MADGGDDNEKTEEPTQKRLSDAFDKGDVVKSQEVGIWFGLAGTTIVVGLLAPDMASSLAADLRGFLMNSYMMPIDAGGMKIIWEKIALVLFGAMAVPMGVMFFAALLGNLAQHRPTWSVDPITPKASKISPLAGAKRLFSKDSLVNFLKGVLKIALVAAAMGAILWPERDRLDTMIQRDQTVLLIEAQELGLKLLGVILAIMGAIAAADFFWQKHKWFERQKMSLQEVKEEYKQQEGDPAVKAKIRQLRMERSRSRMMASVPDATVVITNPTHFAVALKYEEGMEAPLCVAKGLDAVALRIREVAGNADVPIVENPPLARALHAAIEIDDSIPEEHYKAVAEVIGYVYRLRNRKNGAKH